MTDIKSISLTELAKHDSKTSCWMAIEGKIFDMITYDHSGGKEMLMRGCGKDMTGTFIQKREQGIFTEKAKEDIQKYLIGNLLID